MAELVQKNLEDMLPELEAMTQVGLFTAAQTSTILKRRKNLEFKLKRRTQEKSDYLAYIQYELNVQKLVAARRKQTGYRHKTEKIDIPITKRIHRLFVFACNRFPNDITLWQYHIDFCKAQGEKKKISEIYSRMLSFFRRNEDVNIAAALQELKVGKGMEKGMKVFQEAIDHMPESHKIRHEYYRGLLKFAEKKRDHRKAIAATGIALEQPDGKQVQTENGDFAFVIYNASVKDFPEEIDLILGFLPICREFDFVKHHEQKMLEDLKEHFSNNELAWDAITRQHIQASTGELNASHWKQCFSVYEEAIEKVTTVKMCDLYIKCCMELLEQTGEEELLEQLLVLFEEASEHNLLSEALYLEWGNILKRMDQEEAVAQVLIKATQVYEDSSKLWLSSLEAAQRRQGSDVEAVFEESLKHVKKEGSVDLWKSQVLFRATTPQYSEEEVIALFDRAVLAGSCVAAEIKPMYLEWMGLVKGNKQMVNLYERLAATKPRPLAFFHKFISLQGLQCKIKTLRPAYEKMVSEYGSTNPDVWLAYIKMEQDHCEGDLSSVNNLHWRAQRSLPADLLQDFTEQLAHMSTGDAKFALH